jgi:hypothetical protein
MRVAILRSNGYIDQKISRLLDQQQIKGDLIDRVTRREIEFYDFIIASYKNKIPNIVVLLEQIVLEQKVHVVYITNTMSIGQFHSLNQNKYFHINHEPSIEIELPLTMRLVQKYTHELQHLELQLQSTKEQLDTLKRTNKAKLILMENGYTEPQAHQFIQQESMKLRISKRRLVNLIIENKIDF